MPTIPERVEELLVGWMDGRKCPYVSKCWMSGWSRPSNRMDLVAHKIDRGIGT